MARIRGLDPRQKPPESVKAVYKHYEKLTAERIDRDAEVVDFVRGLNCPQRSKITKVGNMTGCKLENSGSRISIGEASESDYVSVPVYQHEGLPGESRYDLWTRVFGFDDAGLHLIPSLFSQEMQQDLLSCLMHEVLADERHTNNLHLHYRIPYHATHDEKESDPLLGQISFNDHCENGASFFNIPPESRESFIPLDPSIHKPLSISQFLHKKLRWITLGGQYDWTAKAYPAEEPPAFPKKIVALIGNLFPNMKPEAAIMNVYTPGDTLSVHRDVSEYSDKGLVSISLGCDGVFVIGLVEGKNRSQSCLTIRLRSGDAIYMSGPSRFAWHGVPKIIPDTCPQWLRDWPAISPSKPLRGGQPSRYEAWRGWTSTKRINLNVRQMKD